MLGKVDRVAQCLTNVAPFGNGTQVENGKRDHCSDMGLPVGRLQPGDNASD